MLRSLTYTFYYQNILELSHFENSFDSKYEIVQISRDYRDKFAIDDYYLV